MSKTCSFKSEKEGLVLVFRKYITTKDGKRIYPKSAKAFPMWVKA